MEKRAGVPLFAVNMNGTRKDSLLSMPTRRGKVAPVRMIVMAVGFLIITLMKQHH